MSPRHGNSVSDPTPTNPARVIRDLRSREPDAPFAELVRRCSFAGNDELLDAACVDLMSRIRRGADVGAEDYFAGFPSDLSVGDQLDLIDAELCARAALGAKPELADYQSRFPEIEDELERLFVLHDIEHDLQPDRRRPPEPLPSVPGYRLTRLLFRDTDSVTCSAVDGEQNRLLLRLFSPEVDDIPLLEFALRRARHFDHPAIIRVRDVGQVDSQVFYTTSFAGGVLLSDLLSSPVESDQVCRWLHTLASAVEFMAEESGLTGDLTPDHVLVDHSNRVRIIGIGRMSRPETGPGDLIRSVGIILASLLAGTVIDSRDQIIAAIGSANDPELRKICCRCFGLDGQVAYRDVLELSVDVTRCLGDRH